MPESTNKVEILVYITLNKERVLGGNPLIILAKDVDEQKTICKDLSKALRGNVVQLHCGDYLVIK